MPTLNVDDFAKLLATDISALSEDILKKIKSGNWKYNIIEDEERDKILISILTRIDTRNFSIVANEDKSRWVRGWGENLDALVMSNGDLDALIPKFYKGGIPLRLNGQFIRTEDPNFEINLYYIYRAWLFHNYLKGFDHIFELGSGSGFNIAELAKHYPKATLHGLDWAQPAVDIIETLRTTKELNTFGHLFDFFHPDLTLNVPTGSAFFSIGAIEQTADAWQPLLDYLLVKKPAIVLHIEPIVEWNDPTTSILDYTAVRVLNVRNYMKGYVGAIQELEKKGRVRILKAQRVNFGSTLHEGWSQLFWQPL